MPSGIYIRTEEAKRKMSLGQLGRQVSEETRRKLSKTNLGQKRSLETRKNMSNSKKGCIPWNKGLPKEQSPLFGRKYNDEHRKKISIALTGKKLSLEHRKKLSESHLGHKHSEATLEKMRKVHLGHPGWNKGLKMWENKIPPWKGKKFSEEHKRKIGRSGNKNSSYGKKLSKETKQKISESLKGKYPKDYYQKKGLKGLISQRDSKTPTSIEIKVYKELQNRGFLFERQYLIESKFLVDTYIPSLNLVIEADGDYWHSLEKVKKLDKSKNAYLTKCGYGLLRLTETEINNGEFRSKLPLLN